MDLSSETTDKLNELLTLSIDSYKGFEQAADSVDDGQVASLMRCLADERRLDAEELRAFLEELGEVPRASGSMVGRAQRWWLGVRAKGGSGTRQLLSEAVRIDGKLASLYDEILSGIHGGEVRALLDAHRTKVKRASLRMQILREARNLYS